MTRGLTRPFSLFALGWAAALIAASALVVRAQQAPPANPASPSTAPLNSVIPVDRAITTGRFANGLRYYIRANGKPEDRAQLRLAVNAGSVLEDDDQRGLAHFVEHMAFNGTKNFPKQDIVNFVQSIGMRFGSHLNAYTSFDETVYQLQVPTDRAEVMDRATSRSIPSRSTKSGASCSRNGGSAAARRAGYATSSSRCCSPDRGMRSGYRSARPRCLRTSSMNG